ncbi:TerC family protein [Marinobacter caseinilyticus]|uniref:TerC family protein n=1 Tax=Marinobacter caseinilyticus TaxID=2692195 RepID=UPI0014093C5A|nr:TerC family protein [Marinobacter caseinilyticus]
MEWFTWINNPEAWVALATLIALEIVLGIDNIIFISILVARLSAHQRNKARLIGLGLAMITRVMLLFSLAWVMTLTAPLFTVLAQAISGRDVILILGGLFLLGKSVHEIHNSLEGEEEHGGAGRATASMAAILAQIAVIDIVFSLDSVITAVGMADDIAVMVIAVMVAVGVMMVAAKPIGEFVDDHPTIKMLALSFLILVGVALLGEGFDMHIPKGYIYFAMAFSFGVEILNLRTRKKAADKVHLRRKLADDGSVS